MRRFVMLCVLCVLCGGLFVVGGCASDRATVDHRAAVMNGVANQVNSATAQDLAASALDVAWITENERRAAVNLSDSYHWRKATYPNPAQRPTSMPYTPEDDTSTAGK